MQNVENYLEMVLWNLVWIFMASQLHLDLYDLPITTLAIAYVQKHKEEGGFLGFFDESENPATSSKV